MPDSDYRIQPLTFERGVNESVEPSLLPAGAAVRVRNWISDPSGNLRCRVGWQKASTTGSIPSTRVGRGAARFAKPNKPTLIQSAYHIVTSNGSSITTSVDWTKNTKQGTLLVMRVMGGHLTNTTAFSVTTPSGGWGPAVVASRSGTAPGQFAGIYYISNNNGSQANVSVTATGASGVSKTLFVEISEWANMEPDWSYGQGIYSGGAGNNDPGTTSINTGNTASVTWGNPPGKLPENLTPRLSIAAAWVSAVGNFTEGTNPNDYKKAYDMNTAAGTVGAWQRVWTDANLSFNATISTAGPWTTVAMAFQGTTLASENQYIVAALADTDNVFGNQYKLFYIDRNNLSSGTWSLIENLYIDSNNKPMAFAAGLDNLFYCTRDFPCIESWNSISDATSIIGSPPGRALCFHGNRLWSGGSDFTPTRLYYSNINNAEIWSGESGLNYIDISTDDGEPIEDLISFGSNLLIGKRNSLWLLSGSDENTFVLNRLTGGGCAPGRSMTSTPYGAVVASRTGVWLVTADGSVESLSRAISKSYAPAGYMSVSFANDVVSICDDATGYIWSFNMNTGVWAEERVDSSTERPAYITQDNELQIYSPKSATVCGPIAYRALRSSTRNKDFDTLSETFEALTPEIWPVGNTVKITPRHLFVRVRQRGGSSDHAGLTITPYYEDWEGTAQTFGPEDSAGVYRYRFDLGERRGINYAQFKFSQTVLSGQASVVDIEEVEFGFNVEQVR